MYDEIIGLKTARFRPAITKTPLQEASSKKNAVQDEKEEKLPVFVVVVVVVVFFPSFF